MADEPESIDLAFMLLDRQLVDSDGRRCGKVDDLDIEGEPGGPATAVALVSGPEAWRAGTHGPIGWLLARVFSGDETAHVHVETIDSFGVEVRLKLPADALGLAHGEDRAGDFIRPIPRS